MLFIWAALSLGFLGSFHCIGMCGPIALALPIGKVNFIQRFISVLIYNGGRILTYSFFGVLFGAFGQSFALFGYQQLLTISLGILILLALILPKKITTLLPLNSRIYSFFFQVKNKLSALFLKEGKRSLFLIGLLNGLLPCGLVYMAVAGSIATASVLQGGLFMAFFGAGTLPVMLALPFAGNSISLSFRNKIRKAVPLMLGFMALLLIVRGLNLGVPYLSPGLSKTDKALPVCHTVEGKKLCHGTN